MFAVPTALYLSLHFPSTPLQVSASGQALVFVVRTMMWSPLARAGTATYIAFAGAQFASTMISLFGFNGYDIPAPDDETVSHH